MPWLGPRARLYRGLLQDLIRVAREDLANFINTERITGHRLVDKRLLSVEELTKHTQRLKEEFRGIPEEYFEGIKEIKALTQADFERAGKFVYGTAEPGRGIIRIDPYSVLDQEGIVMHEVLHMLFPNVPESKIRNLTREALKKIGLVLGIWGLGILTPEQAEAAPLGPIRRVTRRVLEGPLSPDATRILKGKIIKGKVVKEVRRGRGDWRYIVFEDGTHLPVDKSYIRSAAAGYGRERILSNNGGAAIMEQSERHKKLADYWAREIKAGVKYKERYAKSKEWEEYKKMFRGDWKENLVPVNKVFSFGRMTIARSYFRRPAVTVTPKRPEFEIHARVVEAIDNYLIRECNLKYTLKRALLDAFCTGTGPIGRTKSITITEHKFKASLRETKGL